MPVSSHDFTPFIPGEKALENSELPDKAMKLSITSAKIAGGIAEKSQNTIIRHMAVINSYYSNLIEGNRTQPHEIRAAQRGNFFKEPAKRDLQLESIAHIKVQEWIRDQALNLDSVFTPQFIQAIHHKFYSYVPESLWELKNKKGDVVAKVIPGEWRKQAVSVGMHVPPPAKGLKDLMQRFCEIYHPDQYKGDKKIIAIMCAHHRFSWIHPFSDGNGRVARLFTDTCLKMIGLESYGIWCLSRGIARSSDQYKRLLAGADQSRQGDYDGRGMLSEKSLVEFCDYMLDSAIDQVTYIGELLKIDKMRQRIVSYVQARNDKHVPNIAAPIKNVAALVLYHAFLSGELDRPLALELCAMPERSARRLLAQLKEEGLLSETSSKSPLTWEIPEHAESWYFPQLTPFYLV